MRNSRTRTKSKPGAGKRKPTPAAKWSQKVTDGSNALDLQPEVFKMESPVQIGNSVKQSAEQSNRRKSSPYRSAMSMLTFYLNRAGKNLPTRQKQKLELAKQELRLLFGKS